MRIQGTPGFVCNVMGGGMAAAVLILELEFKSEPSASEFLLSALHTYTSRSANAFFVRSRKGNFGSCVYIQYMKQQYPVLFTSHAKNIIL